MFVGRALGLQKNGRKATRRARRRVVMTEEDVTQFVGLFVMVCFLWYSDARSMFSFRGLWWANGCFCSGVVVLGLRGKKWGR